MLIICKFNVRIKVIFYIFLIIYLKLIYNIDKIMILLIYDLIFYLTLFYIFRLILKLFLLLILQNL